MTEYSAGPWKVVAGRPGWLYIVSEGEAVNGMPRHIAEIPITPKAAIDAKLLALAPDLLVMLDHFAGIAAQPTVDQLLATRELLAEFQRAYGWATK